CESSTAFGGVGSAMSRSVGSLTPWTSGRGAVELPSIRSGPKICDVRCGCAGKTCTGCEVGGVAMSLGRTLSVIADDQFVESKTTAGLAPPMKRGSLDDTTVLPSLRIEIVTVFPIA